MDTKKKSISIEQLSVGYELPGRSFCPDSKQLFLYNASLWNAHRIHFDYPYAKEVEGYPELVLAGPLLGDWMHQCLEEWLGLDGRIKSIDYSNRIASYLGETLYSGGSITAIDLETKEIIIDVFIKNVKDEVVSPGTAAVEFSS